MGMDLVRWKIKHIDTKCETNIRDSMESFSGNLPADLLDVTSRYLAACKLKSFVLALPFCDETLLDRRAVLSKVLSNTSGVSKEHLFEIIQAFGATDGRGSKEYDSFSRAYDMTLFGKRQGRQSRRTPVSTTGIRTTLRPSTTALSEKLMVELSSMHESAQIAHKLDTTLRGISQPEAMGFVMIIAAKKQCGTIPTNNEDEDLLPIAGGIVEILDPEEHCLRCIWCDPRLTSKEDSEFGKILVLRLLGHVFDYGYPGSSSNTRLKHTSVLNVHGILFPTSIYTFMINGLKFGKHFETEDNGGSHEDSNSNFCRCQRLEDSEDAELFWGISESRLRSTFSNIRSQVPLKPSENTMEMLQTILQQHA